MIRSSQLLCLAAAAAIVFGAARAAGDESVVTTLADFEDDSVAVDVRGVERVLAADCSARFAAIPARGRRSLALEIGATGADASATCDLRFRVATPFDEADRVVVQAWIKEGEVEIGFRVRDASYNVYETPPLALTEHNRWVRLSSELTPQNLKPLDAASGKPEWPIEIQGFRIHTSEVGRRTIYIDDLEVEHRVNDSAILRGEFELDSPTHLYEPGADVYADLVLENISMRSALPLTVQLQWLDANGVEIASSRTSLNLPRRDAGFRSRQPVRFDHRITEPGLYRLVAQARAPGWITPAVFETTVAATYSNRGLPRGRETFFGVRTNLLREPPIDQLREILIAREIGVQLLAVETPWRALEPDDGAFDFEPLDRLIKRVAETDMAVMLVMVEPPAWLGKDTGEFWRRQQRLLVELAGHFGGRVAAYEPATPGDADLSQQLQSVEKLRQAILAVRQDAIVSAPPINVPGSDLNIPETSEIGLPLEFETRGDSAAALEALAKFAEDHKRPWRSTDRWLHEAAPLPGAGETYDALAVLRHYVTAAQKGAAGVIWFDLRDDTNDPRHAEQMRGLVRRDYSPKTPLLGLANAIGMLHGLTYVGPLPNSPDVFDTALFIGGTRQVAVLFPKPNRVLPAALAPFHMVESGSLTVFDFARRHTDLLQTAWTPLAPTMSTPFFIELNARLAQAEPMIALAQPWLRAPADVYCGEKTTFRIEIDAHTALQRSYLALRMPPGAPFESDLSSRAIRAAAGDTLSFDVTLTRSGDPPLEPIEMPLRVSLEGRVLEVPIRLHSLWSIDAAVSSGSPIDPANLLGHLRPSGGGDDSAIEAALHASWERRNLQLAIAIPAGNASGATLRVGVALEGADTHAEAVISEPATKPTITPASGTTDEQVRGWRSRVPPSRDTGAAICEITIAARSLGISEFKPGARILLAARYEEPRPGKLSRPLVLEWGSGLGGARDTSAYQWVELAAGE